jgi:outer membrane receptor protein involved in Fe transport
MSNPHVRRINSAFLPLATAVSVTMAAAAGAADEPSRMGELLVTATKRSEALQDVPIAVSAITTEDIRERGLTQAGDYLNTVPGVYFQESGPGTSTIRIRGVSESAGGSTVATYFGETVTSVLVNQGGKPNIRFVDIDRVEVLRGPQGTIFGADALAGVVRIIPAAPDLEKFGAEFGTRGFTTAHSDDESYHVEGVLNLPIAQDRVALRLVGYKDDIAGYIDNVVPDQPSVDYTFLAPLLGLPAFPPGTWVTPAIAGFTHRDINSEDTWGARAALRWQASDRLRFDLTYIKQDVELDSEPHTTPAVGAYDQSRAMDAFETGMYDEQIDVGTLVIAYDWDAVSLVSASSWTQMDRSKRQDITFLALGQLGVPIPWDLRDGSKGELFTQEVRLQSRGDDAPLQWTVGAFYLDENSDLSQFVPDFSCPTCIPALFGEDFAINAPLQEFSTEKQKSLFGEVSYAFTPQWTVGAGARYLEDDIESADPVATGFLGGGGLGGERTRGSTDEINPSAYVRYEPSDAMTFYAQAGRGFRSGVVNGSLPPQCDADAAAAGLGPLADPDSLWNYELGMKSLLAGGRFGLNLAVYEQKWKDVQLIVSLACAFGGVVNGGDASGKGLELELVAQPISALRMNLSASYNKLEFDRVQPGTGFEKDERLPNSPEKNANLGVQYNFTLNDQWGGFARGDYTYVGDVPAKFPTGTIKQPSYDVVNARLGFDRGPLALELFGRNLTDKRAVLVTTNIAFGGDQTLIRPREYGVELRYAFH